MWFDKLNSVMSCRVFDFRSLVITKFVLITNFPMSAQKPFILK